MEGISSAVLPLESSPVALKNGSFLFSLHWGWRGVSVVLEKKSTLQDLDSRHFSFSFDFKVLWPDYRAITILVWMVCTFDGGKLIVLWQLE